MHLTLWINPRSKNDSRLYINGSTTLGKAHKAYIAAFGSGSKLMTTKGVDIKGLIYEMEDAGLLKPGIALKDVPFATLHTANNQPPNATPSGGGPAGFLQTVAVGDRASETEALDLQSIKIPDPVKIVIDHREPEELFALISNLPNVEVIRDALDVGDILINDEIIIERKCCTGTRTDFEASIIDEDKRLFTQSEKLRLQEGAIPIVLIEGPVHTNSRTMLIQQIDGALSFLAVLQGMSVINTLSLHHTAYFLLKIATHHKSGLGYSLALRGKKPSLLSDQLAFTLEGMPGVSTGLARDLADRYGSLAGIVRASKSELLGIKGLGPKKLDGIWGLLHGK